MASAGDVLASLEKFELDLIEKQWAEDIWSNEFTSCPDDLPDEFADKFSPLSYCDIVQVIEQADKIINTWLTDCVDMSTHSDSESSSSNVGPSWTLLQEVDYKTLLALLYYYICKGHINNQDVTAVHVCVKSTSFYFTLLMVPGSNIYKVFNLTLFEKCLETFSLHKYLEVATGTMIKKATSKKNGENDSDEEFLEMDETLTLSQQQNVVKQLNFLLSTFQQLVKVFSFKKYPEALNMSLNMLAELTRVERKSSIQEYATNNSNMSLAPLSRNAYMSMKEFCSDIHGRVPEIVRLVLYYIMPNLTLIGGPAIPEMAKYNNKELTNIRQIAVSFVTENIIPMGECTHSGLKILIQQLCFNMIDRADYRTKATEMVLTILCKLPMDIYYSIIKWIFCLALTEGVHHRVIGLELLSKLVYLKPGSNELSQMNETYGQLADSQLGTSQSAIMQSRTETLQRSELTTNLSQVPIMSFSQPINYVPIEYRRAMLAIIIDRIRDEAATVRTRALSILSELLANKTSPTLKFILQDLFIKPYLEMEYISGKGENENEFLKWKSFINAIEKVRDPEVNKSMIPGGRIFVSKVFEKCLDERVNVRKAALQVISKIFKLSAKWMTNENLELFGAHCRDPALSIRKDMVASVTELMLFFPGHEPLTKLWVEEVVPQITDREIRVQEQVLQVFTNTILNNITTYEKMKTPKDELPWKLLDRIADQKMKSFLVAACALWSKSGQLPQNLIKTVKTHVGTSNDKPAWVLLSSISEYIDIEKPEFVFNHYLEAVAQGKEDEGTSHLVLVTLNNSWQKLSGRDQEALQSDMFARLRSFSVNSTMTVLTVDIATGITVTSAEDELSGKQEVAKWAIEMIQNCEIHLEGCLKCTDEKTSDCDLCINVLSLLGSLSGICPEKIKHTTFLLLYDFLMKARNKPTLLDSKMRAITVLTLAKMALRCDFFARSLVAGLAQLLNSSNDPVLINNVVVAIADIGERYANLIEPLISSICVCLKSKHKAVKEITLILLIELLQEDYLKARGALVFHLLTLINDSDPRAVNIVKYYFTNCLIARHPYKMYQLLLPGMFHLNNYLSHPDYPRLEMTDKEWKAFDLSGAANHQKRMNVYQFMLSNVPDMVRMKCLHFICTVVLNGVADNIISIKTKNGEQLLFDALSILLTKEIKIEYNDLVKKKNEDGEEEDDQKQNPLYKLGKQMFTAAQKKEIIETIIPICCKLKKKLIIEHKKLLPYLHKFVRELVKEYKDEINEIFKEDKQFGVEILHEIDKIANNEASEEEEEEENDKIEEAKETEENADNFNVIIGEAPHGEVAKSEVGGVEKETGEKMEVEMNERTETEIGKEDQGIPLSEKAKKCSSDEKKKEEETQESNLLNSQNSSKCPTISENTENKQINKVNKLNLSLIEEYDSEVHGSHPKRNSNMQRNYSSNTCNSDASKCLEVRVQVERLSLESEKSLVESEAKDSTTENLEPSVSKEVTVTSERIDKKCVPEEARSQNLKSKNKENKKEDESTKEKEEKETERRQRESKEKTARERDVEKPVKKKEEKEKTRVLTKKLSVSLERLAPNSISETEKSKKRHASTEDKSGSGLQLSVSLERLDPKYLPGNKNVCKKRMKSDEEVIEKGKEKVIMPPPASKDLNKRKRSLVNAKSTGGKIPKTPDAGSSKSGVLTSTPMIPSTDKNFDTGLSPIFNSSSSNSSNS